MTNRIVQDARNHLLDDLRSTHGDNLASVVLYGSAAAGDHHAGQSDYNMLIALHRITPEDLRLAQAPIREWQRLGHPVPIYFTVAELKDAADVFPVEFYQMEQARLLLYGRDPFEALTISGLNLRHQVEYELRGKLLYLRRMYIPASASAEKLAALMADSLSSFATLFAPVLLLHNQKPSITKQESVRQTVRLLGIDREPFERIFAIRAGDTRSLTVEEANNLFAAYMAQIERVIEAVDRLPVRAGSGATAS